MSWWESSDGEIRVLIAPDTGVSERDPGHLISLRHPKSGTATSYLFINDGLQELQWFKQSYGSWFLGDYVCEVIQCSADSSVVFVDAIKASEAILKNCAGRRVVLNLCTQEFSFGVVTYGSIYTSTPVDPVFIMLPIFESARMKKGEDPGKFRQLDEIMFVDGFPGYQHLLGIVEKSMGVVCQVKEIGSTKFFRLDDSKVLAWLCEKVERLKQTLLKLDKNYAAQDEKRTLADVVLMLGEYLKDEPWMELLCNHLRLNIQELTMKTVEQSSSTLETGPQSFTPENGAAKSTDKKTGTSGRQAKKLKPETNSRNIKDMFTRATRSKSKPT